jgi:predicted ATPase
MRTEKEGTLAYLETHGLGPANRFILEPAPRLTLITGDNGLGKTFLLECAWWALTGTWAGRAAFPSPRSQKEQTAITFAIEGKHPRPKRETIAFDWTTLSWPETKKRPTIPGLTVYARVDGSFAVWDPVQQLTRLTNLIPRQSVFTSKEVWDGLQGRSEGLVRDWVRWQNNPSKSPFETFVRVLAHLSPPDLGKLAPGDPVRIPGDSRDIPTIRHPYGETPIVYESAGVRRIITLAYLIVWAWHEHQVAAELAHRDPQRRMVVLVDEMEAHLHPRWQRVVLPALLSVDEMLASELKAQYIVATHSPLVMASAETIFDAETDSLVHLDLSDAGEVSLREIEFVKFGDVSSWLTSPIFELKHARSKEAEDAIEEAKALQMQTNPSVEEVRKVSARLVKFLAQDDKFWPRWLFFAEKLGVFL